MVLVAVTVDHEGIGRQLKAFAEPGITLRQHCALEEAATLDHARDLGDGAFNDRPVTVIDDVEGQQVVEKTVWPREMRHQAHP